VLKAMTADDLAQRTLHLFDSYTTRQANLERALLGHMTSQRNPLE